MKLTRTLLCAAMAVVALAATAQDSVQNLSAQQLARQALIRDTRYVFLPGSGSTALTPEALDSIERLMNIFYINQYRHFQDPKAPYLMMMSKDKNFAMGIGGTLRLQGLYDWNGSIEGMDFSPYLIDIPKVPTQKRRIGGSASGTTLLFTILGRNSRIGNYMGYIEANFKGYKGVGFKLKNAYFVVNDWTVGLAKSTFCDPATIPPTIDDAGPNGQITKTNLLVRYFHTFNSGWSVAGGLELPSSQPRVDDVATAKCDDYVPDMVALGQYQWDDGQSHVRLSGLLRVMAYRDLVTSRNYHPISWGAQLSAVWNVAAPLTLYAQANVGQGYSAYSGDLGIDDYDLMPALENGRLYAPTSVGVSAGLQCYFLHNVYGCLAFGDMHYLPRENPHDASYKYGLYGAANVFWQITPRIQVGAEYLIGNRRNFNGESACADRVDVSFELSF